MEISEPVVIDFETYYADDYTLSLKRYNTSEYIRDEQFLIHGVGIKCGDDDSYWVAGHNEAITELRSLNLETRAVVAHNMAFDGFILHEHCGIHPAQYIDTLAMSRATIGHHSKHSLDEVAKTLKLGTKTSGLTDTKNLRIPPDNVLKALGKYCINDVELCYKIYQELLPYIPEDEMKLIDITLRMFCEPKLLVNLDIAQRAYDDEINKKARVIDRTSAFEKQLASNDQFAELLKQHNVDPPLKISPTTGEFTYAFAKTDPGFKALLNHPNEEIQLLAEARKRVKSTIGETRALRLLNNGSAPLPVLLNYAGTHTYRWSGGNKMNLQNFPKKSTLRDSILAPPGHKLLVFDLGQIEARLVAWLANEDSVLDGFQKGRDIYVEMACKIYGLQPENITEEQRFLGKTCILGLGYGMGWKKLKLTLAMGLFEKSIEISEQLARRMVNTYRSTNPKVKQLWDQLNVFLELMATNTKLSYQFGPIKFLYRSVELPCGLALKYPGLTYNPRGITYFSKYGERNIWGGAFLGNIIQALARCIIAEQILEISRKYFVASMSHDEVLVIVPNEQVDNAFKEISNIMTKSPSWAYNLPLKVDGIYGQHYQKP